MAPLAEAFPGRFYVGRLPHAVRRGRCALGAGAARWPGRSSCRCCAHNDVHTHARDRQPLQDVLTAIRHKTHGGPARARKLFPNAERTLKAPGGDGAGCSPDAPEVVGRTLEIADSCHFSLDELRYQFPEEDLPPGHTAPELPAGS